MTMNVPLLDSNLLKFNQREVAEAKIYKLPEEKLNPWQWLNEEDEQHEEEEEHKDVEDGGREDELRGPCFALQRLALNLGEYI